MENPNMRIEKDSLGDIEVPKNALYGPQTQRAIQNFTISGLTLPRAFIQALGFIKGSAAAVNASLQLLPPDIATAIIDAADAVANGIYDAHFPVDVFQTGSGTSTNMNANEVIATLASQQNHGTIHPNDHVNMGQSSNDVIPAAIHISCSIMVKQQLLPALKKLKNTIATRKNELKSIVKTGRTHLMDALPITFGQELGGWEAQILAHEHQIKTALTAMHTLTLGGTAVGTGLNAHPEFGQRMADHLSKKTGIPFIPSPNYFMGLSSQDAAVSFSAKLRGIAVTLTKISNDLRLMNSGPLTGFAEIALPALQPGSSIMPGKVNPVIPEAVMMAAAQVFGLDTTIALAGLSGNFQLNTMLPLIAYNLLQSIQLISNSMIALAEKAIAGFTVQEAHIQEQLSRNPILVTALNPIIGYEKSAEIAKRAYQEGKPIKEIAQAMTNLSSSVLEQLLDPSSLTLTILHL